MSYEAILRKYIHELKVLEMIENLRNQGYQVFQNHKVGNFEFDIMAVSNHNKTLYIEVRSGNLPKEQQQHITKMAEYVKSIPNSRFELVVANPPRTKDIEITGLETMLYDYIINEPSIDLYDLTYRTLIEGVCDVEIDNVQINKEEIIVSGSATVEVIHDLGEGDEIDDSFPLNFSVTLNHELEIVGDNNEILINTSSFYE